MGKVADMLILHIFGPECKKKKNISLKNYMMIHHSFTVVYRSLLFI